MSIPAGTDHVTACGAALIEHGSARYSWNERPEDIYVLRARWVEPRIKVYSSLADFIYDLPGTFCIVCRRKFISAGEHTGQNEPADKRIQKGKRTL